MVIILNIIKINKKVILGILIVAIMIVVVWNQRNTSNFVFVKDNPEVEINSEFDALENVKEIKGANKEQIKIDTSKVNLKRVGEYPIVYQYQEEQAEIIVSVVDHKAPSFSIKELEIDLGMRVEAKDLVKDVKDDSEVKIYFEKNYSFDKIGDVKVTIIVEDTSGNQTRKKSVVHVLTKDTTAPILKGVKDITMQKDGQIDFLAGIQVSDNRDPNPNVKINIGKLNLHEVGDYEVIYEIKDRSGNRTTEQCMVHVVNYKTIGTSEQSDEKVIYLTFDDGPSKYTKKILDILDQYNAKATFFVTGTNEEYFYLIKETHDQGHTIGLHSYNHEYNQIYVSKKAYYDDLKKISDLCHEQLGFVPKYIRFPGGSSNNISKQYNVGIMSVLTKDVIKQGYQYYDWDISSGDGKGSLSVNELIKNATVGTDNNIVILCHDANGKENTVKALPSIIKYYQDKGYRFAGINDSSYVPHHTVHN